MSVLTNTACRFVEEKFRLLLVVVGALCVVCCTEKKKKKKREKKEETALDVFYAFKWFAMAWSRDALPGEKEDFNQRRVVIFASFPTPPSLPLVSLNLHSKAAHSHGGSASCLIVPSVVKKSQGYVNNVLCLFESKFTFLTIDVCKTEIKKTCVIFHNVRSVNTRKLK